MEHAAPEKSPEKPRTYLLPYRTRMIAFGLSAFVVCLAAYQKLDNRRPAATLPSPSPEEYKRYPAPPKPPLSANLGESIDAAATREEKNSAASMNSAAPNAPGSVDLVRSGKEGGEGGSGPYTNESLQGFLGEQRAQMGIRKILPPAQPGAPLAPYETPGYKEPPPPSRTMDDARALYRRMAEDIEQAVQARQPPSVKLKEGTKPDLLSAPHDAASSTGEPVAAEASGAHAAGDTSRPASNLGARRGVHASGIVVRNEQDLRKLWDRLGTARPVPQLDFRSKMLIVVYASAGPDSIAKIESVAPKNGKLVVRYHILPAETDAGKTAGFAARVVPAANLPVIFRKSALKTTANSRPRPPAETPAEKHRQKNN